MFFEQLFDVAVDSGAEDVKLVSQEDDKAEEVVYEVLSPEMNQEFTQTQLMTNYCITGHHSAYGPF